MIKSFLIFLESKTWTALVPVVVSGGCKDELLGILKFTSGTGCNEAKAVYDLLEAWKLTVDSTSVNTVSFNRHNVLLENDWSRAPVVGLLSIYHKTDLRQGFYFVLRSLKFLINFNLQEM